MPRARYTTALFLLVSALIVYGSLYPFAFDLRAPSEEDLVRFFDTLRWTGSRGDILGNIALFLPLGFLAALLVGEKRHNIVRLIALAVWTLLLAFGLQAGQLYLPTRDAALRDGLWNLLGTGIGLLAGLIAARRCPASAARASSSGQSMASIPVVLAGCWIGYRLAPFLPSLDWQSIKDSLKPLLVAPALDATSLLRSFAGWMAFAALWRAWRGARWSDALVIPMVLVVMAGEVLVVRNAVTLSNVAGAAAGLAIWWGVKGSGAHHAVVAAVMALTIAWIGLEPFTFAPAQNSFHMLPFRGFLGGSMYVNFQQLLLKFFMYGSLIWLLARAGAGIRPATAIAVTGLLAIELTQIWQPGRTPELTDAVLALMAAGLMHATDAADRERSAAARGVQPARAASARERGRP